MSEADLDAVWNELVTTALLGTDRRDPPVPGEGPVADLVADALRPDPASRMLAAVGAVTAARRAGFVPLPVADLLQPPDSDDRPWCPAPAVATWREVVRDWPVLEDEWVLTVLERGYRLAPDVVVDVLARHRSDPVRRARVALAAGPTARWVVEHVPSLGATAPRSAPVEAVTSLPVLPVPPELHDLLVADAHTVSRRLRAGFEAGEFDRPHRAVLVNFVARCRPEVLVDLAAALASTGVGLALALADEARLRQRMRDEFAGTAGHSR